MKKASQGLLKAIATRGVIAAIPVAMVALMRATCSSRATPNGLLRISTGRRDHRSPNTVGVAASPCTDRPRRRSTSSSTRCKRWVSRTSACSSPGGSSTPSDRRSPAARPGPCWTWSCSPPRNTAWACLREVDSTPPGGVAPGTPAAAPPDPATFAAFMTKFVTKYGYTVSAYEIWNEPNGHSRRPSTPPPMRPC